MRELINEKLWLGNAMDASKGARLHELGIRALVDLAAEELPPRVSREMIHCRFPICDGSGNEPELLSMAVVTTASLIRQEIPTLVFCSAGMSRAPAVGAAALAIVRDQDPDECLAELVASHPHDVSPALWAETKSATEAFFG